MNITLNHNVTVDIKIEGGYMTNASTVTIVGQMAGNPNLTVNNIYEIDDDYLLCNITTNAIDGLYDVIVTNETGTTTFTGGIEVELSVWEDLRLGGTTLTVGTDVRMQSALTMQRDTSGISFTGANPWESWVKMEKYQFSRASNSTLQWIFTGPTTNMMIGIGSTATNEASTLQFSQAENEAYFNSATSFWGLYGNNGTIGTAGNQNQTTGITNGAVYKIKFTNSGSVGGEFTLYQLPSANQGDWDDESNIIVSMTIGGTLNPDEPTLMPFIIPRSASTQRFIALKIE